MAEKTGKTEHLPQKFDIVKFQNLLQTKVVGRYFIYREVTDTTMRIAEEQAKDGAPEGTLILAERQTKGRGRGEKREWNSTGGENLLFTIICRFPSETALLLPLISAIAICSACRQEGVNAWIKWPNDVWVGSKKISGLLIDSSAVEGVPYQSIGIGVNVNENFEVHENKELQENARSLWNFLKRPVSREMLLANICNFFEPLLHKTISEIKGEYVTYEKLIGRKIIVMPNKKEAPEREHGTVIGYEGHGFLQVMMDGEVKTLSAQEVSVRMEDVKDLEAQPLLESADTVIKNLITGIWKNQLESRVHFIAKENGVLEGEYMTAVGNDYKQPLYGSWCSVRDGGGLISFTVAWVGADKRSTSAWSGRLFRNPLEIVTTWTLTTEKPRKDQWGSVTTNKDTFQKLDDNNN